MPCRRNSPWRRLQAADAAEVSRDARSDPPPSLPIAACGHTCRDRCFFLHWNRRQFDPNPMDYWFCRTTGYRSPMPSEVQVCWSRQARSHPQRASAPPTAHLWSQYASARKRVPDSQRMWATSMEPLDADRNTVHRAKRLSLQGRRSPHPAPGLSRALRISIHKCVQLGIEFFQSVLDAPRQGPRAKYFSARTPSAISTAERENYFVHLIFPRITTSSLRFSSAVKTRCAPFARFPNCRGPIATRTNRSTSTPVAPPSRAGFGDSYPPLAQFRASSFFSWLPLADGEHIWRAALLAFVFTHSPTSACTNISHPRPFQSAHDKSCPNVFLAQ